MRSSSAKRKLHAITFTCDCPLSLRLIFEEIPLYITFYYSTENQYTSHVADRITLRCFALHFITLQLIAMIHIKCNCISCSAIVQLYKKRLFTYRFLVLY